MRSGRGKKGSLRVVLVVWKLLAGIEDGFDNGWPLIRADAGSLFFPLLLLLCALLCQNLQIMKSRHLLLCVPGADLKWTNWMRDTRILLSWCRQKMTQVPQGADFSSRGMGLAVPLGNGRSRVLG